MLNRILDALTESRLILALLVLGLIIRVAGIPERSLWWDEFVSIDFAEKFNGPVADRR